MDCELSAAAGTRGHQTEPQIIGPDPFILKAWGFTAAITIAGFPVLLFVCLLP
jgi:hypothetical protein